MVRHFGVWAVGALLAIFAVAARAQSASQPWEKASIQVGGTMFPVGASMSTLLDLKFINLDYSYAFFQDNRVRLSLSGGVHTNGVHYKLESPGLGLFEDEKFTAPLPVAGFRGEVVATERWRLKGGVDLFYLEYDRYPARLPMPIWRWNMCRSSMRPSGSDSTTCA